MIEGEHIKATLVAIVKAGDLPEKPAWFTYEQACKDALTYIAHLEKELDAAKAMLDQAVRLAAGVSTLATGLARRP